MNTKTNFKQLLRDMSLNGIRNIDARGYKWFCGFRFKTQEEIDAEEAEEEERQKQKAEEEEEKQKAELKIKKIIKKIK